MAERKLRQMERLKGAFGLSDVKEGEAFDPEAVAARRQSEKAARDAERAKRETERQVQLGVPAVGRPVCRSASLLAAACMSGILRTLRQ